MYILRPLIDADPPAGTVRNKHLFPIAVFLNFLQVFYCGVSRRSSRYPHMQGFFLKTTYFL